MSTVVVIFREGIIFETYLKRFFCVMLMFLRLNLDYKYKKIHFGILNEILQQHKQNLSTAGCRSVKRSELCVSEVQVPS